MREYASVAEASPKRFSMMAIKTVVAGALGEGLEIYRFPVFSFFAVYISRAFFPQQGPTQSLLLTVATLGLGFVTRPLGAFYLGMYADRFGRKKVLTLTMWLMCVFLSLTRLGHRAVAVSAGSPALAVDPS